MVTVILHTCIVMKARGGLLQMPSVLQSTPFAVLITHVKRWVATAMMLHILAMKERTLFLMENVTIQPIFAAQIIHVIGHLMAPV